MASTTLTGQCHCKSVHFTITVPTSSLPLPTHLCHCFVCRQTHGSFCCFHAPLPNRTQPIFIAPSSLFTSCTGYTHSPAAASIRYFCSTCGCHIGDHDIPDSSDRSNPEWRIATSILSPRGSEFFKITTHFFADTFPGTTPAPGAALGVGTVPAPGLHTWVPRLDNRPLKSITPAPGPENEIFPLPRPPPPVREVDSLGQDRLRTECHCGGVKFWISRPSHPSLSPSPSLSLDKNENGNGHPAAKSVTSPVDGNKWKACLDVCDDCRLVTGAHVIGWMFVAREAINPSLPSPERGLEGYGMVREYVSSEGVVRGFCKGCGATVFYTCVNGGKEREGIVDVAVGLLRAPEGVAAGEWVTWRTGRVAHLADGRRFDKAWADAVEEGFREWGVKTHGEALDFEIP